MEAELIQVIVDRICRRTDIASAVPEFMRIVENGHEGPLTFDSEAIADEIAFRLALDIISGDRYSDAESITAYAEENEDGYYNDAAILVARHLGNLVNEKTTVVRPNRLYRRA